MTRNLWLALIAGIAVVVLAVGLLALLDDDDIALPDEVGGLVAADAPAAYADSSLDDERLDAIVQDRRDAYAYNNEKAAELFDGAQVATRIYVDVDDDYRQVTVIAVEADAGPLLPSTGFPDPDLIGYALPSVEWSSHGDVECLGNRVSPPQAGTDYDEEDAEIDAVTCQRRTGSLTVRVSGNGTPLDDVVELTDDLWDEVS